MKFTCDQCNAQYMIADEKVGTRGVKVKCKKCGNIIVVKPAAEAAAVAVGGSSDSTAVGAAPAFGSAFGGGSFGASTDEAKTTVSQAPVGGGLDSMFAAGSSGAAGAGADFGGSSAATGATFGAGGFGSFGGAADPGASSSSFDGGFGAGGFGAPAATTPTNGSSSPGFDDNTFNLGALASGAAAPAASTRAAGEKEWYVAIDDAQVGPVDIAEIEQRWDAKELHEETLAWKGGMSDWLPLAEIPELAFLVSTKPHQKAQPRVTATIPGSSAAPITAPAATTYGGGGGEEISWKPSAASALSSLVQEELVAAQAPKAEAPVAAAPAGMPSLGGGGFGSADLFGGGASAAASSAPDPFAAPAPSWNVPVTTSSSGGSKVLYVVLGLVGVLLVGLVGFVLWFVMSREPKVVVQAPVQPPPQVAQVQPAQPVQPQAVQPARPQPAQPEPEKTDKPAKPDKGGRDKPDKGGDKPDKGGGKVAKDPLERIDGGGGGAASNVKAQLDKEDVVGGFRKNAASLAPCIKDARGKGELVPKAYTFTLDFNINPDGSISGGKLAGPAEVMGSSLPACFATAMRRWSFPASQKSTPVKNIPLPVNIR